MTVEVRLSDGRTDSGSIDEMLVEVMGKERAKAKAQEVIDKKEAELKGE